MTEQGLTVDEAVILAEFSDDPDALRKLTGYRGGTLKHMAQRIRNDRAEAAAHQAWADAWQEQHPEVRVIEGRRYDRRSLSELRDDAGELLNEESHAECPGHAAAIVQDWGQDDEVEPYMVLWLCADPEQYGHHGYGYGGTGGKTRTEDLTEEQREAAREQRRTVVANNKAWTAAETVRREWVRTFATRRSPAKGCSRFVLSLLAAGRSDIFTVEAERYAASLLGLGTDASHSGGLRAAVETADNPRSQHLLTVLALAACEVRSSREDWRTRSATTAAYLAYLRDTGYELAEVEELATDSQD